MLSIISRTKDCARKPRSTGRSDAQTRRQPIYFLGNDLFPHLLSCYDSEQKANIDMASLPLLPNDSPRLMGIARLAAHGESVRQGHEVEYFTMPVRSLLNRCVSRRQMPFTWTINPYRGCEFACKYCYARYTHEFMEMRRWHRIRAENLCQAARRRSSAAGNSSSETG